MDVNKLQDNDSLYNESTICYSKQVNGSQGDGFSSMDAQVGAIKLAMAGA